MIGCSDSQLHGIKRGSFPAICSICRFHLKLMRILWCAQSQCTVRNCTEISLILNPLTPCHDAVTSLSLISCYFVRFLLTETVTRVIFPSPYVPLPFVSVFHPIKPVPSHAFPAASCVFDHMSVFLFSLCLQSEFLFSRFLIFFAVFLILSLHSCTFLCFGPLSYLVTGLRKELIFCWNYPVLILSFCRRGPLKALNHNNHLWRFLEMIHTI